MHNSPAMNDALPIKKMNESSGPDADHDPFSNWDELVHMPVYSSDKKKIGYLRTTLADYMVIKKGLIVLNKYFVPKSFAESVDNKGRIRLRLTSHEVRSKYPFSRMKHVLTSIESVPMQQVESRPMHDRLQTFRHGSTRNRMAASAAIVSGLLFLFSGYKANLETYNLLIRQLGLIGGFRDVWNYIIYPVGVLALISQLGGIAVLIGAAFFLANRVNFGKFLIMLGTGQGLFTIIARLALELWSGHPGVANNYVLWLTSSAAGLGILFAILSQSISKGGGESIAIKVLRAVIRIKKE